MTAIQQSMAAAQQKQKQGYADRKCKDAGFTTVSCRNFLPKFIGPFKFIEQVHLFNAHVGEAAYKLDLPPYLKWHPVFHVALLVRYKDGGRTNVMMLLLLYLRYYLSCLMASHSLRWRPSWITSHEGQLCTTSCNGRVEGQNITLGNPLGTFKAAWPC